MMLNLNDISVTNACLYGASGVSPFSHLLIFFRPITTC